MKRRFVNLIYIILIFIMLSITLVGCNVKSEENKTSENDDQKAEVYNEDSALIFENSLDIKYAEHFSIDYYKDGYKIIRDASDRKILIVPEGGEIPSMEEETIVIQQPIETFASYVSFTPSWFSAIDELHRIVAVTQDEDEWQRPDMAERVGNGKATFVGKTKALDYELLQSINPNIHLVSQSGVEDLSPKFDELGFNYLSMGSYLEDDPRGRLEWIKFIAALLNKEEEADNYFEEELARIEEVEKKISENEQEKPKVTMAYYSTSNKGFRITNIKGYKVKNIEMAGGSYYPNDLGLEGRGATGMTPEEFYKLMSEIDILIYDSVSGHSIQNLDEMLEAAEYLKDTKVFKEGRIWGLKRGFWQIGEKVADITEDYYKILFSPHGEIEETEYFYLMK